MKSTEKNASQKALKRNSSIIVIGAGIAGIVAARALKKKGHKVIILEQSSRIAGKCDTFELDGFEYNLGGHVLSQKGTVRKLAESVGLRTVPQPFTGAEQVGEFCLYDFRKGIVPRSFDLLKKLGLCEDIFEAHEGLKSSGYKGCIDLAAPIQEWLKHHNLEEMVNDFRHAYTCAGYGFLDGNLSAAYYLKYVQANDFGLLPTCTPEGGFRKLLLKLAEGLDIRLSEKVLQVDRKNKLLTTSKTSYSFDELVICCPNPLSFLDSTAQEKALFSKVKTLPYATVLVDVFDFPDTKLFNLVENVKAGHVAAFARFNPNSNAYNVYAYLDKGMTMDDLVHTIREDFKLAGATTGEVHFAQKWDYFPHVSPLDFAEGFYDKVDALQGQHSTWFLGSLVAFELTNCVVENVLEFVEKRMKIAKPSFSPFLELGQVISSPAFKNIIEAFNHHLDTQPNKKLYTSLEKNTTWNYQEISQKSAQVATKLLSLNLGANDAVLLIYPPDSKYFPIGMFGCLLAGVIAVPLPPLPPNPNKSELTKFKKIVRDLNCTIALTDSIYKTAVVLSKTVNKVKNVFNTNESNWPDLKWIRTDTIKNKGNWTEICSKTVYHPKKIAYLQYTSGSLNQPKAVTVTHDILAQNLHAIGIESTVSDASVFLGWVPWFHDMGLVAGFLSAAYSGAHYYFYSPLSFLKDPSSWLKYIDQYKITSVAAPNFGYELAAKRISQEVSKNLDLSSLKYTAFGGERTRPSTVKAFHHRFASNGLSADCFRNIYGMAESVLYISGAVISPKIQTFDSYQLNKGKAIPLEDFSKKPSIELISVGPPSTTLGVSIIIINPTSHKICPPGAVGEICISSPSIAEGYYQNETASKACFKTTVSGDLNPTSYMRTGDLGFLFGGEVFICGREKELIIFGGRNIYPEDIEAAVMNTSNLIRKGCVAAFGIENNDLEQVVVVAEVKDPKKSTAFYTNEVVAPVLKELSQTLGISSSCIVLVKARSIPKTSSGKIKRKETKQLFLNKEIKILLQSIDFKPSEQQEELVDSPEQEIAFVTRSAEEISDWLVAEIAKKYSLSIEEIDCTAPLSTLGIDSISVLVFVQRLSQWLGYPVELSAFYYHPSISELARYLVDSQDFRRSNIPVKDRLLVTINPELPGKPIYAIRPAGGSVMGYTELSEQLNCPIKAIQAASQITHTVPEGQAAETVPSLAKEYASILLAENEKIEVLMGYSFGGIVAFEMAKHLPDLKEIILIDCAGPGHGPGQGGGDKTVYEDNAEKRNEIIQIGWAVIFPLIRDLNRYNYFPAGVREQFISDSSAFLTHYPLKTKGVNTTLIRATIFEDTIERSFQHPYYRRDDFGWRDIDSALSIIEIPTAHHFTLMIEPSVSAVAAAIHTVVDKVELG